MILLDIDGVLADYTKATAKALGFDHTIITTWHYYPQIGHTEESYYQEILKHGTKFWEDIEPYEWYRDVYDFCRSLDEVTLVTAPPPKRYLRSIAAAGKVEWIHRVFGDDFKDYFIGCAKSRIAADKFILVDDSDENVIAFRKNGGKGVVFPQPWNTAADRISDRMTYLETMLRLRVSAARKGPLAAKIQ